MFSRIAPSLSARRTVAGVMAAFTRTIEDLNAVEREHKELAERHAQTVQEAQAAHAAAVQEAAMAREVSDKLSSIIVPSVKPAISSPAGVVGLKGGF